MYLFGIFIYLGYNISMKYDVIIIGAGPAGLSAGIFACRAGLKTICLEKIAVGGQAVLSHAIENYPGFNNISGFDLMQLMQKHAELCGLTISYEGVEGLVKTKTGFKVTTSSNSYEAKQVIIASGAKARKFGLENEKQLIGKGVSYCASCDGNFFKNKPVAVVGGGNTAIGDVEYLSRVASKVYLINRSEVFRANPKNVENLKTLKNVEILTSTVVTKLVADETLKAIEVTNNGANKTIDVDALFIAIGYEPDLTYINFEIDKDEKGYIIVDKNMKTSIDNLYACGDITSKSFKQIISACADGAIAGNSCVGVK